MEKNNAIEVSEYFGKKYVFSKDAPFMGSMTCHCKDCEKLVRHYIRKGYLIKVKQ